MKRRTDHYASYKDPAAKVFYLSDEENFIFRQLDDSYLTHYNHLKISGLSAELIKKNLLIPFEEISDPSNKIILKARRINFVSYPYEWTFNQWKDAALLTLKVQYHALKFGMTLKDATPFNIVFDGARPLFIDLSSFEIFEEGKPWQAFKQFSENFYLPLLMHKYFNAAGNQIYLNNTKGISLEKGLKLLPAKASFNLNTLIFLTLPNKIRKQTQPANKNDKRNDAKFTLKKSIEFADQLFSNINQLKQRKKATKWNSYYDENVDLNYLKEKEGVIKDWFKKAYADKTIIDFGCNTGNFSRLLSNDAKQIIAFDEDIYAADELYVYCRENKINNISSFTANISEPTPATGWNNLEHSSLKERLQCDAGLALALVHHLAITNYIRFEMMADFFADTCKELVIEFVPKEDEKVQLLLTTRQDIFDWYNWQNFIKAFEEKFTLVKKHTFKNNRVLVHFLIK